MDFTNHPLVDPAEHNATLTWTQVCERTGRTPHALMQRRSITTLAPGVQLPLSSEGLWDEVNVQEGTLEPPALNSPLAVGHQVTDDWFTAQSPNPLWPADRSWCVASEMDVDSTLIGGSAELIEAVLVALGLDAWAVCEDDDPSLFADTLTT